MASTPRERSASTSPPSASAIPALFESEADADALERMLLVFATHPEGVGAMRAWLVLWNARSGLLEGWREAERDASGDLASALARARRGGASERVTEQPVRAWAEAPERLEGPLAECWRGAGTSVGAGGALPGAPWQEEVCVATAVLRRGARAYGVLVSAWADAPAAEAGRERLEALRRAGDAALGAQSRAAEARRRARQAGALAEMARTSVSAINLAEALHLLARLAAQGIDARGAAVFRADAEGALSLEVAHGPAALRDRFAQGFLETARDAVAHQTARSGERATDAAGLPADIVGETSVWAVVPLLAHGHALGALVVHDGLDRHPASPGFERGDLEFLGTLADQAALLLEHARQQGAQATLTRQRRELQGRLGAQERLVALGELATRVAQEARNPLVSIAAFAKRAHKSLAEGDPQREYLEIVIREAGRLESMLREQLEYAALEAPRLQMQSLNLVVQDALQRQSETLVRRRVRLLKKLAPELPNLLLDAPRIRRVIENVVEFALESLPLGGRLKVESHRVNGFAVVEVAHDGARQGGDLLEQLFVPFASGKLGGAAVGLGMAQQIVREHGGEVRVRSEGEWGTIFSFTLPVAGNEERRRARDRRGPRPDRRRRDPRGE